MKTKSIIILAIFILWWCGWEHHHEKNPSSESFSSHGHDWHSHDENELHSSDVGIHEQYHDEFDYGMLDFDENQGWHEWEF